MLWTRRDTLSFLLLVLDGAKLSQGMGWCTSVH
jgi:hypothetical protein